MSIVEKLVVLWYDRTSEMSKVSDVRQYQFSRKSHTLENIPPTFADLKQHTLRAVYQGGHVWGQTLFKSPNLPCPSEWGWEKSGGTSWNPRWTTIGQA